MAANPRAALIHYLLANTDIAALVETRIWPELPEKEAQQQARAAIVITESGGGTIGPGAESYADWENTRMDILCFGKDPYEASNLQRTVTVVLKRMERTVVRWTFKVNGVSTQMETVLVDATITGGPISGRDPDTDWPFCFASYNVSSYEERC